MDGSWTDWADATTCSVSCGNGTKDLVRHCANPIPQGSGANCAGLSKQSAPCYFATCPFSGENSKFQCNECYRISTTNVISSRATVGGAWTEWSDSMTCSVTCGTGTKEQVRYCANPAPQGSGAGCRGPTQQTAACFNADCPISGNFKSISSSLSSSQIQSFS